MRVLAATLALAATLPIVQVSEKQNGGTVTVRRGQELRVVLHSTYWTINPASNSTILRLLGTTMRAKVGGGCVAGQGCGTMTGQFHALKTGKVTVTASRTSCGEALRCTGTRGHYKITVIVRR
jgi:hypothetical protein